MAERLHGVEEALRPPTRLTLSEWADLHFVLSPESAAEPGRWRTLPYQRGVMDAITDPDVERVTLMKSARVGFTKIVNAAIGYYMHQDPCPILVVQPTVEDAAGYSKEEIAPMIRDVEVLSSLVGEAKEKISEQTILAKTFPGGVLTMIGANSARGFRRISRRVVIFDEVDGYPPSAGKEGDQIQLGIERTRWYWNRKIIAGSTPLIAGSSRIESMFLDGDQRRYHVPCVHCGRMDYLVFRKEATRGHYMRWADGEPEGAYFVCRECGGVLEDQHKAEMLACGDWIAEGEFRGHASFHIWAAYSLSPNATWGTLAREFTEAKKGGSEKLKTYITTALAETWKERGEAPDWEILFDRREDYPIGSVPAGARFLTCGVDVQKDRFVFEVLAWATSKESWSVEADVLMGDTSLPQSWLQLDALLARSFAGAGGRVFTIAMMAVDSGYNTQQVYGWCRRHPINRVRACKGVGGPARQLIAGATLVDVNANGKRMARGYRVFPVGVDLAKSELYGWLRAPRRAEGEPAPDGTCHFPGYDQEFFRQLTAEILVAVRRRTGFVVYEWQPLPNRENHFLDCRVLNRAAAAMLGIDRLPPPPDATPATPPPAPIAMPTTAPPRAPAPRQAPPRRPGGWISGRPGGWLGPRRR